MDDKPTLADFEALRAKLAGEIRLDGLHRALYATDASVYRERPEAVAFPKTEDDIVSLIAFAAKHKLGLIPRAAGTSLGGQVVGRGLVVDCSKHFTAIEHFDREAQTVTVQPGVIRDELNMFLKPYGLFFSPNTSTANRCTIGGMVGNNSSGTTSIAYGVTRDKVISLEGFLSDGSRVCFSDKPDRELQRLLESDKRKSLEARIYEKIISLLSDEAVQREINTGFPKRSIHRRNSGYALDELIRQRPFTNNSDNLLNLCKLLAGSEGTLCFLTKITLKLDPLPPHYASTLAPHFNSVLDACAAVKHLMKHKLFTCELMDKNILECTKNNKLQAQNRSFVEGDPQAILMLEVREDSLEALEKSQGRLLQTISTTGAYACPILRGEEANKAIELRNAGLGLLSNVPGDDKGVACVEDTAVDIEDLEDYIKDFTAIMDSHGQQAVYYAHAGAGELHLRPILNLKRKNHVRLFRQITAEVAALVKKYNGSMSGEHSDGRVRSEFISQLIGAANYDLLRQIKDVFDPHGIFNPGKIVNPLPMDAFLRFEAGRKEPEINTFMDFSDSLGIIRALEKCNGSADCRKTHLSSGAMCPSYHATKDEKDTTRARANVLREFLTHPGNLKNRFDQEEIKQVLELCLGCKSCLSECPSNVDMTALKAEALYQYYKAHPRTWRDIVLANNHKINWLLSSFPMLESLMPERFIKKTLKIHPGRTLPRVNRFLPPKTIASTGTGRPLILLIDEYSLFLDGDVTTDVWQLFSALGYQVEAVYYNSTRAYISKGFLEEARADINRTLKKLSLFAHKDTPLVGIEPSSVLGFRDDYLRLATDKALSKALSERVLSCEEFIWHEARQGRITADDFTDEKKRLKAHLHCHFKALSLSKYALDILNLPKNYDATLIDAGCCGMAGAFGYEEEHYGISMAIGALKLFPAIGNTDSETLIIANGTSCRHQIKDGAGRHALHPATVLKEALRRPVAV